MKNSTKGILAGIAATVGAGVLYALSNRDREPKPYSADWFDSLSDDDLDTEREKVRQDMCNPDLDNDYKCDCRSLLYRFDDEIRARRGDEDPQPPSYPREHGHNLYKPD